MQKLLDFKPEKHCPNFLKKTSSFSMIYLVMILYLLLVQSCTNENDGIVKDHPIKLREGGCTPGSFSESGGRLVFPTADDFKQTVDFFECASPEDIDDWSRDFDVETPGL